MKNPSYKKDIKNFWLNFNLRTEGVSFILISPILALSVWFNMQLTLDDIIIFLKFIPVVFISALTIVLINNRIAAAPVVRYFKKLLKDEQVSIDEYTKAKKRFLMLPYIHSIGAFFRWILCLGLAIAYFSQIVEISRPDTVTMFMGVGVCAIFGLVSYFFITEIYVQSLLNKGIFSEKTDWDYAFNFSLLKRLTVMVLTAILLPFTALFAFLYGIIENLDVASLPIYLRIAFISTIGIIAGLIYAMLINKTILDKVNIVVRFLKGIGRGNLEGETQDIAIQDEISQINNDVYDMKENLRTARDELLDLNLNLEKKVANRTEELQAAMEELEAINERLTETNKELEEAHRINKRDMDMAVNVQATLFPKKAPESEEWDIAFVFRPMSGVSGDLYDFYANNGKIQGISLFDVSGHGIASGLITMIARSVFHRNFIEGEGRLLNQVLEDANRELISEMGNVDNYLTGIILRFNKDSIEYVNAGHPELICRKAKSGDVDIINLENKDFKGLFIGADGVETSYETLKFNIHKNDSLLLYTDCLYESKNTDGDEYGFERIHSSFKNAPNDSSLKILDSILDDFYNFTGKNELKDDLTAIIVQRML